jgi:hypothetical protein
MIEVSGVGIPPTIVVPIRRLTMIREVRIVKRKKERPVGIGSERIIRGRVGMDDGRGGIVRVQITFYGTGIPVIIIRGRIATCNDQYAEYHDQYSQHPLLLLLSVLSFYYSAERPASAR